MRRSLSLVAIALSMVPIVGDLSAQEGGRYGHYDVYDQDLLPRAEYADRRTRVLGRLSQRSAMIVRSAEIRNRSNDVDYEYRQRNNLLYLTGIPEANSALLLIPAGVNLGGRTVREVLFVEQRNPALETWNGIQLGPEVASEVTGIEVVLPYDSLPAISLEILPTIDTLFYDGFATGRVEEPLTGSSVDWPDMVHSDIELIAPNLRVVHAGEILHRMRAVKSKAEMALMQRAVDISIEGHRAAMRAARPGITEYQLEAAMEYTFRQLGAEEEGYPSIVGSGPNTCILHYSTNRRRTEKGDLALMDCGAEYHGYSADITRTFPVDGRFTKEQRTIYDLVLKAQNAGIEACKPGASFFAPHRVCVDIIANGLVELGIIESTGDYARHFMHGTSHYLGMDVHDVNDDTRLREGMVLTVEPGVYIAAGSDCDPKWWNIGIRIEDDIYVGADGPVNLSAKLERTAEEIEGLVGKDVEED